MTESTLMTPATLIDALGGTSAVADGLGLKAPVVSNWKARGKIPAEMWSEIAQIATERGLNGMTLEALATMHARRAADKNVSEART